MKALFTSLLVLCGLSFGTVTAQRTKIDSRAECLQRCLEQYQDNMEECEDSCFVCDVWILFCVAGHTDEDCMETCSSGAEEVYEACKAECPPPPQPHPLP